MELYISIRGDKEIIHVDKEVVGVFCKEVSKDVSHCSTECGW